RDRPSLGSEQAPVVVIAVSSYKCQHCRVFHGRVFPRLRERYIDTGQVRWVAINASPEPTDVEAAAFMIARCAQRDGQFWQSQDFLFEHGRRPSSHLYGRLSAVPGLEAAAIERCVRQADVRGEIAADFAEATALGVKALPTLI